MKDTQTRVMPDFCDRHFRTHYVTALNALSRMGVDLNRIDLIAIGMQENYRGEVHYQEPAAGTPIGPQTEIRLKIGASSAVDYMPYQFFYGLHGVTRRVEKWEDKARSLMAPFDGAVIRYTARCHEEALTYGSGLVDRRHIIRFLKLFEFEVDAYLPDNELLILASLLPQYQYWSGNADFLVHVLSLIFPFTFEVTENVRKRYEVPDAIRTRLGRANARLGAETVLGGSFVEGDSAYRVTVSDIPAERANDLVPGKPLRTKLEWLIERCMPSHLVNEIELRINRRAARLGRDSGTARVGYSAFV